MKTYGGVDIQIHNNLKKKRHYSRDIILCVPVTNFEVIYLYLHKINVTVNKVFTLKENVYKICRKKCFWRV
jgi:hypothetical protein